MSATRSCTTATWSRICGTRGAVFVDELDEIPAGAMTVFSAHGVAKRVEQAAADRGLPVIDATCPLVAKVHNEGRRYARQDREIVLVGHAGHAEVEGTIGQVPARCIWCRPWRTWRRCEVTDPDKLAYITQTTLSVDDTRGIIAALKARFPSIVGPGRARHLLCHAEPPAGGARSGAGGRHDPGGRVAEHLQFQPPAGNRRGTRQARPT